MNQEELINLLETQIKIKVESKEDNLPKDESFFSMGLDSLSAIEVISELEKACEIKIDVSSIWEFDTLNSFTKYIFDEYFA